MAAACRVLTAQSLQQRGHRVHEADHPKLVGVLYFAFHGIAFLFLARVGIYLAGGCDCALHSPPAGYLLDFCHPVLGWVGALIYIVAEVIPDAGLLRTSFQMFPRRRRIHELERAILDNPSAGNYEELGLLYLDNGDYARARASYDKAIASRTDSVDAFYRRGVAEVELGDFAAAVPDLERAVTADANYDFHRAKGLLAHAYAQTGQADKAEALFQQAVKISTSSETYYNYAVFLQAQGRVEEARQWAQKILDQRQTMPGYQRRRERVWFRRAYALLARSRL